LVDKGTSFQNAFISYPLCCPARATILTGLYAHNHGVKGNTPPDGGFQKFLSEGHEQKTIAVRLQEEGYRTALFGKYLNGYPGDDPTHVPPGWDDWYGKLDEQELYNYRINENGQVVSYGNNPEDFYTDVLSKQATDFVGQAASDSKPFFLYLAPTAPHVPATPAERHKGAFARQKAPRPPSFNEEDISDKPSWLEEVEPLQQDDIHDIDKLYRKRLESMLSVDDMVDSLIRALEDAGRLDDTFIFFTSDNGFEQGQHRLKQGKRTPYEESVHVPLFVRGPGVPAGSKVDKLVVNTDFAPTFADLAGGQYQSDGRSLVPLLHGDDSSWRSSVLLEGFANDYTGPGRAANSDEGVGTPGGLLDQSGLPPYEAIRTETQKYVEYESGEKELYDLEADPDEMDNLEKTQPEVEDSALAAKLAALEDCSGQSCREAEDSP
jgi:arylsulfatase A-like enzyme